MRLASFEVADRRSYGVATEYGVRETSLEFRERYPDLRGVLAAGALGRLAADSGGETFAETDLKFLPVIPDPDKILCVGVNYRPHALEMGRELPTHPVIFTRFAGSLTGHDQPVVRPRVSEQFDFEGEIAVIIGKPARHVSRGDAMDYVAGYSCFLDGSVRDWQRHTMQFTPGKNFEQSGALGPWLVTVDDVPNPTDIALTTTVSGEIMQNGRADELIFDIPDLVEYISTFTRLLPGDVIATGTPGGVGAARKPPRWLRAGDTVEVDLGPVGRLVNPVRDEAGS